MKLINRKEKHIGSLKMESDKRSWEHDVSILIFQLYRSRFCYPYPVELTISNTGIIDVSKALVVVEFGLPEIRTKKNSNLRLKYEGGGGVKGLKNTNVSDAFMTNPMHRLLSSIAHQYLFILQISVIEHYLCDMLVRRGAIFLNLEMNEECSERISSVNINFWIALF